MSEQISKSDTFQATSELFKMLSSETRVSMLMALRDGPMSVGDLANKLGLEQAAVSHQLKNMRYMSIVSATRDGRSVIYALKNPDMIELIEKARQLADV